MKIICVMMINRRHVAMVFGLDAAEISAITSTRIPIYNEITQLIIVMMIYDL
jgi:hypothetical protein